MRYVFINDSHSPLYGFSGDNLIKPSVVSAKKKQSHCF